MANIEKVNPTQYRSLYVPALAKQNKLTISESIRSNPFLLHFPAIVASIFGIILGGIIDFGPIWIVSILSLCFFIGAVVVTEVQIEDRNTPTLNERKNRILGERLMNRRPHKDLEQTRLKALKYKYDRYSVKAFPDSNNKIKLMIISHKFVGKPKFCQWKTEDTRYGFGGQTWGNSPIEQRSVEATDVNAVQARFDSLQESARELEQQSYDEALQAHKINSIIDAVHHPSYGVNDALQNRIDNIS